MDSALIVAIVTSVSTAGSTAGVAITALLLSNKRIDRVEAALDRFEARMERTETRFLAKLDSIDRRLEMLTGSIHEIDKRLSIIEDLVGPKRP